MPVEDFFLFVWDYVHAEKSLFRASMPSTALWSLPRAVRGARIFPQLSPKGCNVLEVCLSSVPMKSLPLAVSWVATVIARPLVMWVHIRVSVGLFVDFNKFF